VTEIEDISHRLAKQMFLDFQGCKGYNDLVADTSDTSGQKAKKPVYDRGIKDC